MSEKYRATIHGNTVEWADEEPVGLNERNRLVVDITVVGKSSSSQEPNGKMAVAILRKIAERGGVKSIPDPVKWQREIRKDRRLPGR
jgi:hypothetical protein